MARKPVDYPARGKTDADAESFFADYYGRDSVAFGIAMGDPERLITLLKEHGIDDRKLETALRLHIGKRTAGRTRTNISRVRINRTRMKMNRAIALFRRAARMLYRKQSRGRFKGEDRDSLAYRVLLKCELVQPRTQNNQHSIATYIRTFLDKAQRRELSSAA